ncbi:MAG: retroviral-like aspartic protease family protein [Caulobacter sp.]|nr:retroviral-like aspartic protease family protein [Caulobacter sp.]
MLNRRNFALAVAGALAPWPAFAREPLPEAEEPFLIDASADRDKRLTIPVLIGDQGPFDFVVDTGADRSALAIDVAEALGLPAGRTVRVQGISGAELTPTVQAPMLDLGKLSLASQELPILPRNRLGVDGLLGVDALQRRRLVMDFGARRLEIRPTSGIFSTHPNRSEAIVTARDKYGRLVVIDATADTTPVTAFVDSGAGITIANRALAEQIQAQGGWREAATQARVYGVTNHVATGEVRTLDTLRLGGLRFSSVPLVVSDLDLFDRWGLADKPTILLGVNVLRLFSRVEMDYGRRRMMFRVGADPMIWQV